MAEAPKTSEAGDAQDTVPTTGLPVLDEKSTTLDQVPPMQVAIVQRIDAEEVDAARLKRLGICEGRQVQLVKADDPLIVRVVGTRVGISAWLAPCIHVRLCLECPDGTEAAQE